MKALRASKLGSGWAVATLAIGLLVGSQFDTTTPPAAQAAFSGADIASARELSTAFSSVATRIGPSVVNISSVRKAKGSMGGIPDNLRGPFREFFGEQFEQYFGHNMPRGFEQEGLGTGVVVDGHGHIVTNAHVVEGADEVTVKLVDNRTLIAQVVGTDVKTDIAVLKIDAENLQPATLGDSDALEVGELVIASGNPFGLDATVTAGIVSAKGRANVGIADYEDFIQTDAAINPGNSGGPLVNLEGEVVGINTAIFSRSGGYMGIGFAIPVNMVKTIMTSLIEEGHVTRGWLGVSIQNLTKELADSFKYSSTEGVLIGDVSEDGPAAKAGLKAGDIIVAVDGKPVGTVDRLRSRVADTSPGSKVKLEVFRDGESREIDVKVGQMQADEEAAANPLSGGGPKLDVGMTVRDLTPALAQERGYEAGAKGAFVTEVEPMGAAAKAGIRPGDLIVEVQGEAVANARQLRKALGDHRDLEGVRLIVRSGELQRFAFLEL